MCHAIQGGGRLRSSDAPRSDYHYYVRYCILSRRGPRAGPQGLGSHQHGVHLHPSALQVLADRGDLVVGQVGRVLLVELQQALQLVLGFVADVLH